MNYRWLLAPLFLALISASALASATMGCVQGAGEYQRDLWQGYTVEFAPASAGTAADQCHAAVKSSDGKLIFEISAPEVLLNDITASDVNADGKPDVVIESHRAHGQCCFTYDIVTPGENPALVREITTSVALSFEDLTGDGKIEISGRDNAFDGFDGLPAEFSPKPRCIFRMRGTTLYYVSPSYWPDYQREIDETRNSISHSRLEKFKNPDSGGGGTGIGAGGQQQQGSGLSGRELDEAKGAVLQIVLGYLYGGNGQEAWKTLKEMWPYPDNMRIRQLILQARGRGLLSEVNRPPGKTASQTGTQTAQQ